MSSRFEVSFSNAEQNKKTLSPPSSGHAKLCWIPFDHSLPQILCGWEEGLRVHSKRAKALHEIGTTPTSIALL